MTSTRPAWGELIAAASIRRQGKDRTGFAASPALCSAKAPPFTALCSVGPRALALRSVVADPRLLDGRARLALRRAPAPRARLWNGGAAQEVPEVRSRAFHQVRARPARAVAEDHLHAARRAGLPRTARGAPRGGPDGLPPRPPGQAHLPRRRQARPAACPRPTPCSSARPAAARPTWSSCCSGRSCACRRSSSTSRPTPRPATSARTPPPS